MKDLIEETLDAVGVPPGMRDRAIKNLQQKSEDEIKLIRDKALERKKRVIELIEKYGGAH